MWRPIALTALGVGVAGRISRLGWVVTGCEGCAVRSWLRGSGGAAKDIPPCVASYCPDGVGRWSGRSDQPVGLGGDWARRRRGLVMVAGFWGKFPPVWRPVALTALGAGVVGQISRLGGVATGCEGCAVSIPNRNK